MTEVYTTVDDFSQIVNIRIITIYFAQVPIAQISVLFFWASGFSSSGHSYDQLRNDYVVNIP